jgi:hypothetical protein
MTSAPKSPSIIAAVGAAITVAQSMTLRPEKIGFMVRRIAQQRTALGVEFANSIPLRLLAKYL